jgi:hypothetical protein
MGRACWIGLGLAWFLALLFVVSAAFFAMMPNFAAGFVELTFGGGEEALGSLVLAVVGGGPVGHFELEEGI